MKAILAISVLLSISLSSALFSQSPEKSVEYVSFTLRNETSEDIKLFIPGVMNPNLTPNGNSGVTLKIGQEVLFKFERKKQVLLVADESYRGKVIDVQNLIDKRIKEINAEEN